MVPTSTMVSFVIAAVVGLIGPMVLLIILGVKKKISALPLVLGATAFFVSQVLVRIPLLSVLGTQDWWIRFTTYFFPYVIVLCVSAGLFEETARLGGALILKKQRRFKDIVSFGLGHGLCEVVFIFGLTQINNIIIGLAINNPGSALGILFPDGTLEELAPLLLDVNNLHVYLGILERFSAVLFHIFATLLVFKAVKDRKWFLYVVAILAHAVFNFVAVLLGTYTSVEITEAVLVVLALAMGAYVWRYGKQEAASLADVNGHSDAALGGDVKWRHV
jgi:uncharacterized membrane protein YhfC